MEDLNERPVDRRKWSEEDWDNLSIVRKIHKKITGITLTDSLIFYYVFVFFMGGIVNFFIL